MRIAEEPKTFDSGFTKREMVVIVEDGKYPQEINLEFVQDKVALLEALQPGTGSDSELRYSRSRIQRQVFQ